MKKPPLESIVSATDNTLLWFHEQLGKKWQERTGKSKKTLESNLYFIALVSSTFAAGDYLRDKDFLGASLSTSLGFFSSHKLYINERSSFKDIIFLGKNKDVPLSAYSAVFAYIPSLAMTILGAIGIATGLLYGDQETTAIGRQTIGMGTAGLAYMTASYLSRIDMDPPTRKKRKSLIARLGDRIAPVFAPKYQASGLLYPITHQ